MSSRILTSTLRRSIALARPAIFKGMSPMMLNATAAIVARHSSARFLSTPAAANLKKVLESELQEVTDISNTLDDESQSFVDKLGFKVNQKEGSVVVELTKSTGDNEVVHVFFDADDVTNVPDDMGLESEAGAAAEDGFEDELDAIDELMSNAHVVIENTANNTALFVNLFLENETGLVVDHFNVQRDATAFLKGAAEGKFSNLVDYSGPSFSMLDENLQVTFEEYLESKGINSELAEFITSYSEFKEEKEYRKWLGDVKEFF